MPSITFEYLIKPEDNQEFVAEVIERAARYCGLDVVMALWEAAPDQGRVLQVATRTGGERDAELAAQWKRDNEWFDPAVDDESEIPGAAAVRLRIPAGVVSANGLAMAVAEVFSEEEEEPEDPLARRILDKQAAMKHPWKVLVRPV